MNKIEYSPLVKGKMKKLQAWLVEHFDRKTAQKVLSEMISDIEILALHEDAGTSIADLYDLDTEYRYLFSHQHYLVYRVEMKNVIIVQMFHEREDFMMKLFGISGRTQESIDYWGD